MNQGDLEPPIVRFEAARDEIQAGGPAGCAQA